MAKKKVNVTVTDKDGTRIVELDLDEELLQPIEDYWCECEEPGEMEFWPDEFDDAGERISKHHYTCKRCGKVTQVG